MREQYAGHFLVDAISNAMVVSRAYGLPLQHKNGESTNNDGSDIEDALECFDNLLTEEITEEVGCADEQFDQINEKVEAEKV